MAAKAKKPGAQSGKEVVTTVVERDLSTDPVDELNLEATPEDGEEQDFASVLAELAGGSEARCEVRRTSPAEYAGYCCTYALSEMNLDRLAEEWGGGKYNVRVRNSKGEFKGSTSIQITGKSRNRGDSQTTGALAAPAPVASVASELAPVLKAIQESTQGQIAMLTGLVTSLLNKPAPAPPPPGPSVLEIISELAPILKPDKGGGDSGDAVKLLLQGIELGKDLGGGGEGGDSMLGLAAKGMDMVKQLAQQSPPRPMGRRPRQQPPPAQIAPPGQPEAGTVEAQPAVEVVNEGDAPMLKLLGWIKQQAALLVHQAKRDRDPQLYADLFLDNIPAGVEPNDIYQRMSSPNAIKEFADVTGNAEVLQHPEWMERFRQAVLARFHEAAAQQGQQVQAPGGEGEGS